MTHLTITDEHAELAAQLGITTEVHHASATERVLGCEYEGCAGKLFEDRSYLRVRAPGMASRIGCCGDCARVLRDRLIAEMDVEPFDEMTGPMGPTECRVGGEEPRGQEASSKADRTSCSPRTGFSDELPDRFVTSACNGREQVICDDCRRSPDECACGDDRQRDLDAQMDHLRDQFLGEREPLGAIAGGGA